MEYLLYYHPDSGHAYKVALFFALTGTKVRMQFIDIWSPLGHRPADFRNVAKFGEVPTLVAGDKAVMQSDNILIHLAEQTGKFGVDHDVSWTDLRMWLFWEANRLGMALPNLRFALKYDPATPKGAVEWLRKRVELDLGRLETELGKDGRPFLLGQQPTIVDLSLCGYIFWIDETEIDLKNWPNLYAWRERIRQLKGWLPPEKLMSFPGGHS